MKKRDLPPEERVVNAFIEFCDERGILEATLQKIARKAGVPFSTAHYHWGGSLERLISAVLQKIGKSAQEYIFARLQNPKKGEGNPLECYVQGTFDWIEERGGDARLWVYFFYHASTGVDQRRAHEAFLVVARKRILQLLFEAKGRGYYPKLEPTLERASQIHALVFGYGIQAITIDSKAGKKALREDALSALAKLAS